MGTKIIAAILFANSAVFAQIKQSDIAKDGREPITFRFLQAIDPTNSKSVQLAEKGYDAVTEVGDAVNTAKTLSDLSSGKMSLNPFDAGYTTAVNAAVGDYTSATGGFTRNINKTLERIQNVLDAVTDRVNRWRTTLPLLDSYAQSAGSILENTVEHISTFHVSDLWDLDQKFFVKLEANVAEGHTLAKSFFYFLYSRYSGVNKWGGILDAWYENRVRKLPMDHYYNKYGTPVKTLAQLPEEERLDYKIIQESFMAYKRMELMSKEEYECDIEQLDCACNPKENECGPKTMREWYKTTFMNVLRDPKSTLADIEKAAQQIENRRVEIAAKRKIISESKMRIEMRVVDVVTQRGEVKTGSSQKRACQQWAAALFDKDHDKYPGFSRDVCNEMASPGPGGRPIPTGALDVEEPITP